MSTPQQKMMLPVHCGKHLHAGYGSSSHVQCPWCQIERLRGILTALHVISAEEHTTQNEATLQIIQRMTLEFVQPASGAE